MRTVAGGTHGIIEFVRGKHLTGKLPQLVERFLDAGAALFGAVTQPQ